MIFFNLYEFEEIRLTEAIAINRTKIYINYYLLCFTNTHVSEKAKIILYYIKCLKNYIFTDILQTPKTTKKNN